MKFSAITSTHKSTKKLWFLFKSEWDCFSDDSTRNVLKVNNLIMNKSNQRLTLFFHSKEDSLMMFKNVFSYWFNIKIFFVILISYCANMNIGHLSHGRLTWPNCIHV